MSLLLEDIAEETSASNLRTADRLDAEARELEELSQAKATLAELQVRILQSARLATEHAISRLPQVEGVWRSALVAFRVRSNDECVRLLRHLVTVFESGERLARTPRTLWTLAQQAGIPPERLDELERIERRFGELASEARSSLDHRTKGWQPADPERLARGMQLAKEGKTVTAEEALARFRRPQN